MADAVSRSVRIILFSVRVWASVRGFYVSP